MPGWTRSTAMGASLCAICLRSQCISHKQAMREWNCVGGPQRNLEGSADPASAALDLSLKPSLSVQVAAHCCRHSPGRCCVASSPGVQAESTGGHIPCPRHQHSSSVCLYHVWRQQSLLRTGCAAAPARKPGHRGLHKCHHLACQRLMRRGVGVGKTPVVRRAHALAGQLHSGPEGRCISRGAMRGCAAGPAPLRHAAGQRGTASRGTRVSRRDSTAQARCRQGALRARPQRCPTPAGGGDWAGAPPAGQ